VATCSIQVIQRLPWDDSRYTGHNLTTSMIPDKRPQRSIIVSKFSTRPVASVIAHVAVCMCLQPSDVDKLSNEEILELRKKGIKLHPDNWASVVKLTPSTVAKASQDSDEDDADASEANALDLLFAETETTIPVPCVRCVVKRQWDFLIVMDYIPGPTLADVWQLWPILSTWQKIRVAFTLSVSSVV
jgi:hypothetical protein